MKRRAAVEVDQIDRRATRQEEREDVDVAHPSSFHDGSAPVRTPLVQVAATDYRLASPTQVSSERSVDQPHFGSRFQ